MRRVLGLSAVCVVLVLVVLVGTSSRADFRVEEVFTGYHLVAADDGSFLTNRSFDVIAFNNTGTVLQPGTVMVLDTVSAGCPAGEFCVKPAPAGEMEKVIGVINGGAVADLPVQMAVAGTFPLEVTGTVAAGDLLKVSSTVAGEAEKAASGGKGVFAIALQGGTDSQIWATFVKQEVF